MRARAAQPGGEVEAASTSKICAEAMPRGLRRSSGSDEERFRTSVPRERGAVTAELAVVLPAIVLLLLALLAVTSAGSAHLRSLDAARAGARALALGESDSSSARISQQLAGKNAQMSITRDPPWVTVSVTKSIGPTWFSASPLSARAQASAWIEP